jgi:inosose dehydratase
LIYNANEFPVAVSDVAKAGYNGIEIYPKDWEHALASRSVEEVGAELAENGLRVSAVFGGSLSSKVDLDGFARAAEIGSQLGSEFVFFVAPGKHHEGKTNFVSLFREAARMLKSKGMTAVLHNHAGTVVESSSDAARISEAVDSKSFGLCFDSVHYALFEDDLVQCVQNTKDYVKYVHLKDIKRKKAEIQESYPAKDWEWGKLEHLAKEYTGLDEGVIDNYSVVKAFCASGYEGWWVVEIERQEYDRVLHASKNIGILKQYFDRVKERTQDRK